MEVFWPGFDANRARNNLNVTMNALRRALGPSGHDARRAAGWLLRLRPGRVGEHRRRRLRRVRCSGPAALDRAGHAALALQAYELAVECYGGELVAEDPVQRVARGPSRVPPRRAPRRAQAHRQDRPRARSPGRRHPGLPGGAARRQPRRGRRRAADDVVPGPRAGLAGVEDVRRLPAAARAAAARPAVAPVGPAGRARLA